ncbi:MAG: hypothetical protein DRI36_05180 [Caldiserica bacterium]|nr:MAG: hypothetical protein DRI36_05180 [Caldisericota bacterium]
MGLFTNKKGWTLVELIIVVAIIGIIFVPLVKIMHSVLVGWWSGRAKLTIQEDARDILYFITNDLKASKRTTVGSVIYNGSLEKFSGDPEDQSTWAPYFWYASDIDDIEYEFTESTNVVHSGMYSLRIREDTSILYTQDIVIPYESKYIFSYWVRATSGTPSVVAELTATGFSVSVDTSFPVGTVPSNWRQVVWVGTVPQCDDLRIRISVYNVHTTELDEVIVDDIALTPKEMVLLDEENPDNENIDAFNYESQTSGGRTELDNFRLLISTRTDNKGRIINRLMRYWVNIEGETTNPQLKTLDYNDIGENVYKVIFRYPQPDSVIESKGKDLPIEFELVMRITMPGGGERFYRTRTSIYPMIW